MCFIPNGVVIDHQVRYSNKSLKKKQKTKRVSQRIFLRAIRVKEFSFEPYI